MKPPKSLKSEIILDEFLKIKKERLQFQGGYEHNHYTLSLPTTTSVSIIPINDNHQLIVNKEYRHPTGQIVLSLPGGFLNDNESPLNGGKRELLEETGYEPQNLSEIGSSYPMPGICDQKVIYVLAEGCQKVKEPELEGGEIIRTLLLSFDEIHRKINQGIAVDGILLTGLWFYQNRRSLHDMPQNRKSI